MLVYVVEFFFLQLLMMLHGPTRVCVCTQSFIYERPGGERDKSFFAVPEPVVSAFKEGLV